MTAMRRGLAAEYDELGGLVLAIRAARARGVQRMEAFTPYPVPELDGLLAAKKSPMALFAGLGAIGGAAGGYFLQWLVDAYLYPVIAGGRPPHMPLLFVIIALEMGFLGGGLVVFFACLAAARLFKLWQPVDDVTGFASATRDGYWLAIDGDDPEFDAAALEVALAETSPRHVERFGEAT